VKHGGTGALLLVTVGSELSQGGRICVREEQDFVYRSGPSARRRDDAEAAARPGSGNGSRVLAGDAFCADPLLLFRFSALTANSHRIHYDHPYATGVEGYPGLVVHGPLLALLMAERAHTSTGRAVRSIDFRFHRPAFAGQALQVTAEADGTGVRLAVLGPDGDVRATGTAQCAGDGA
jgi:3-methylfumaryl-CoA hydratase